MYTHRIVCTLGKRFVLFDDVKGRKSRFDLDLPHGCGVDNLDDMRDHLDGHIPVQLEQKNQQPVSQRFPCGVITMNHYVLHDSLKRRIKSVNFVKSPLYDFHCFPVSMRTIYIAMVFDNLIPAEPSVVDHCTQLADKWRRKHTMDCPCYKRRPKQQVSDQYSFYRDPEMSPPWVA